MRRIRPVSGRLSRYLNLEDREVAMYGDAKGLAIRIIEGSIWGVGRVALYIQERVKMVGVRDIRNK